MFKVFLTILVLLLFPLQGQNYCLRESLEKAESGNYVVYEQARFYTLLYIKERQQNFIIIDEVSVAAACIESMKRGSQPFDFVQWLKGGSLNSSAWITYSADLTTGLLLKTYSHVRKTEQSPNPILSTLMNLSCEKATLRKMAKNGTFWNPPLPFEGGILHNDTSAWRAKWPSDASPLSGADLIIYTAEPPLLPLPYWIEIDKEQKRILLRAIASGRS